MIGFDMNESRLSLIGIAYKNSKGANVGNYLCSCGNAKLILVSSVESGNTKSCGCLQRDLQKLPKYKNHGMCNTPTYKSWAAMKRRCIDISRTRHHGRGITYCERWESFDNFLSDMGERPKGMTIDRIDNNGNYEPSNCKWSTVKEQSNNRANSIKLEYQGKLITIYEWSAISGIPYATINARLKKGWDIQKVMYTPVDTSKHSLKRRLK